MIETSRLLDKCVVVQPFKHAVRLPRGHAVYRGQGESWKAFAAIYKNDRRARIHGDFNRHGHTGFAWACRRDVLECHGLYDFCIAGSGDHMIAHGFCGDVDTRCTRKILGNNPPHRRAFETWTAAVSADVGGRIGYVPGMLLHLWHGEIAQRRYVRRNEELAAMEFDPHNDIRVGHDGCWEWNSDKPQLHRWAVEYFRTRHEDGLPPSERPDPDLTNAAPPLV